ncbi:membrane protein [Christiangramia forsetii KT0803]|uniref:Membrane protein n=2 Tax=Christiangramia forsetii TaxID=411153 RepID=A0M3V8_CHRFK|nr:membrane protein [Christiangramia forsetii KT0803]
MTMHNQEIDTENQQPKKNIWNLVLGIVFLGYGSFRLYQKTQLQESDTFGIILAVGFIIFGIYDLYKYFKGV